MTVCRCISRNLTVSAVIACHLTSAASAANFPIVVRSSSELLGIGLAVSFAENVEPFENKCYYYGDGGYLISFSDAFFDRFRKRGFSVQSVCLGLISNTRYDPETGTRLPTYVIADEAAIGAEQNPGMLEPGALTEELPLDLPNCFKGGTPYTDCKFRFGRLSGKRLSKEETLTYHSLGLALDEAVGALAEGESIERFHDTADGEYVLGFRIPDGYFLPTEVSGIDEKLLRYSSASVWVRGAAFPHSYGYALDADGASGPSVSADALNAYLNGKSDPQIDVGDLQRILGQ